MIRPGALLAAAGLALAAAPAPARAASCCGGIGSTDPVVLPKWDRAAVGLVLQYEVDRGMRASDGAALAGGSWAVREPRALLGAAWRLGPNVQVGAGLPVVGRTVSIGDETAAALGVGDLGAALRVELMDEASCFLRPARTLGVEGIKPSIHLVTRVTLPTGQAVADPGDPMGATVAGRGYAVVDEAVEVTKVLGILGARASASLGGMSPVTAAEGAAPALRWGASAGLMAFSRYKGFVSLGLAHREERYVTGGGTASTDLTLSLSHYDLGRDVRVLVQVGALGLPPSRSTALGWVSAVGVSRVF